MVSTYSGGYYIFSTDYFIGMFHNSITPTIDTIHKCNWKYQTVSDNRRNNFTDGSTCSLYRIEIFSFFLVYRNGLLSVYWVYCPNSAYMDSVTIYRIFISGIFQSDFISDRESRNCSCRYPFFYKIISFKYQLGNILWIMFKWIAMYNHLLFAWNKFHWTPTNHIVYNQ